MNAIDFMPENVWDDKDSRKDGVEPRTPPWTGEQLRKTFHAIKSH
jgi:hypothetical protein